jgi:hypothetical protein
MLPVVLYLTTAHGRGQGPNRASLMTVEGIVSAVETLPVETGGDVTSVRLMVDKPEPREMEVLLAPESALRQTGFEIEVGDRLRARIFLTGDDALEAHKVLNLSRGMMVRLRTLRRVPLWDGNGQWQGGPCRAQSGSGGAGGHQHRGSGRGRR